MEFIKLKYLYIGLWVLIKPGSAQYFQNCSEPVDKYLSCDANRNSDCYYKVLKNTPSEWQLDGWVECSNCLTNFSLVLQSTHKLNLHFTAQNHGNKYWQGILVNITFLNANKIRSLRRWFLIKNTINNLNSFNYNCIYAFDNPHSYKVDMIKIYWQDERYSVWNSEWFSILTAESLNNNIQVCFNTPPRVYDFSGFEIFLIFSQGFSDIKKINNTGTFEQEICVIFASMPTNNYTAKLGVTNKFCECNKRKVPYIPDANFELDLCNCPFSLSRMLFHKFESRFTTIPKAFPRKNFISNFKMKIILQDAFIVVLISSTIIFILFVVICILVKKHCCLKQNIFNTYYFGKNLINAELAKELQKIYKKYNKQQISVNKKNNTNNNIILLIHDDICNFLTYSQSSLTIIERRCFCFKNLEAKLKDLGVMDKLMRASNSKNKLFKNITYEFPHQALGICQFLCEHESVADEATNVLISNIKQFIEGQNILVCQNTFIYDPDTGDDLKILIEQNVDRINDDEDCRYSTNSFKKKKENIDEGNFKMNDSLYNFSIATSELNYNNISLNDVSRSGKNYDHDNNNIEFVESIGNSIIKVDIENNFSNIYICQFNDINHFFDLATKKILISIIVF